MTSIERHEARYQRRKLKREQKRLERSNELGSVEEVFSFHKLFETGKKCCNGVRWKNSTQRFETHLFSQTASTRRDIINGEWEAQPYNNFTINERGKTRVIDAPKIQDRQVHKVYTKEVLLPLYAPEMIYNNGASLKGKGLHFSQKLIKRDLHRHFNKYGMNGSIILIDFHNFFPDVSHEIIYDRHNRFIINDSLRIIGDTIINSIGSDVGVPLGVETSQIEMVAFPSALDNYIKCQLSIKGACHYMDDYYILVPPNRNPNEILDKIKEKAKQLKLNINDNKTHIVPFGKPFRYCKAKYIILDIGKIITRCNSGSIKRDRHKIKAFLEKVNNGIITYNDLWNSINSMYSYIQRYNNHKQLLKLRRLFYALYGFSSEKKIYFDIKGMSKNEVYST